MERERLEELLYQSLETERGGVEVYTAAVGCAQNPELKEEFQKYLDQTKNHVQVMTRVLEAFGLEVEKATPGREILRMKAQTHLQAMQQAMTADPVMAQLVAAESVVEAEAKDHQNWELIGEVAKSLSGTEAKILQEAFDEVEEEEDQHLYHTMGWARELWLDTLGLPAVIPPPEEKKETKTAIGADRARQQRTDML
jgi:ferritin-like metal-binding protein YciE